MEEHAHSLRRISRLLRARRIRKKVVLTGGTFDIIHPGHLNYLAKCRHQGDILVVCVAGDARTRRRKGPSRPLLPAVQRARILSNLKLVDFVFISNRKPFSEPILQQINPDVVVTSSNEPSVTKKRELQRYMRERHPEIKVLLTHRPSLSWSSSSLINRILDE